MKRILICGSNGLLGQRLALMLSSQTDYEVLNTSRKRSFVYDDRLFDYTQLDITKKGDVKSLVSSFNPTTIINAAAAADVDWCELHREEAWKINVVGVENLIEATRKVGARLIHISTDYVFDGTHGPYGEDDRPNPISYYGKTKLASENAVRIAEIPHAIFRTIVLYGSGIGTRDNFPIWVIKNLRAGKTIRCSEDQISNPTHVNDIAFAAVKGFELNREGIYHICGSERISRYQFAVRTAELFGLDPGHVQKVKSADLNQVAPRPPVTGFVTLKAQTELGLKPMDITQGLTFLKRELQGAGRN
ncbi:MAG: dTDP-4-dehydrorhamnose reductase [Ignavibacteriales bacterium]|nr:dTDP-4-dehydrorhamnose reductase [Ignavibacteriales bacterium]